MELITNYIILKKRLAYIANRIVNTSKDKDNNSLSTNEATLNTSNKRKLISNRRKRHGNPDNNRLKLKRNNNN